MVAVIGDGALTGGMAWEALNNIAAGKDRRLVIVVNDNGRSYSPTIGGLASHLAIAADHPALRARARLRQEQPDKVPVVGPPLYDALHGDQEGPQGRPGPAGACSRTSA